MKDEIAAKIGGFYEIMSFIKSKDLSAKGVVSCAATIQSYEGAETDSAIVAVHYDRENADVGLTVYWGDYALARQGLLNILNPTFCGMKLVDNKILIDLSNELHVTIAI